MLLTGNTSASIRRLGKFLMRRAFMMLSGMWFCMTCVSRFRSTDARRPGTQYSRAHSPGDSGYYLLRSGIPARFQLALNPGNYVLHVAVRDNTNGHIGSLEMPVQVQK